MEKSLRILCIVNLPWDPRLGAARVWIELSEQWKRAGHSVERFCLSDAFPRKASRGVGTLQQMFFPRHAAGFVRENAARFDVVDCLLGTLPFSKENLRFRGLLVGRSIGFYRSYEEFLRSASKRWPNQPHGRWRGRFFYSLSRRELVRHAHRAVRHCDLLNLPNEDEFASMRESAPNTPAMVQPYGLTAPDAAALYEAAASPEERLRAKHVVFIGMWSPRKGSLDWRQIIAHVRRAVPDARFSFLGTSVPDHVVERDLGLGRGDGVECVSYYDPQELPRLLSDCTVGIFPSYIEGFGLAVLEKIAAGIPAVAYDVPGPRQILWTQREMLLTPEGNMEKIAARAVEILQMNVEPYRQLSDRCHALSTQFRWEEIARATAHAYCSALEKVRSAKNRK